MYKDFNQLCCYLKKPFFSSVVKNVGKVKKIKRNTIIVLSFYKSFNKYYIKKHLVVKIK